MLIAESETAFREFLARHGKAPEQLLPEDLLTFGFSFFEQTRASDALPISDDSFGDALLFQWGSREALPPHYGECFYFDLTRQFISQHVEDDDAMFQLTCQLQYELTPALRAIGTSHRSSLKALPEFKVFALTHPALAAVAGCAASKVDFYFTSV